MADYEIKDNVLTVRKDLGWPVEKELREQCDTLLEAPGEELIVDLTPVRHICSANMVAFASLGMTAQNRGKKIKLKVSRRAGRSFQLAGFHEFLDMEVVGR